MNAVPIYIDNIPWKTIGAFLVVAIFCGIAFYKEFFLLSASDKEYYKRLEKKSKTKVSGRTIVAIIGALLAVVSFLLAYIFYMQK